MLPSRPLHFLLLCSSLILTSVHGVAADKEPLSTPPGMETEVRALATLIQGVHYNRDAVKPSDVGEMIPDFMEGLDAQRLFFLDSDLTAFNKKFQPDPDTLFWNITFNGNIDAAYDIFKVYDQRVRDRVAWILEELKKDLPLTGTDTYVLDRDKAAWPANDAAADDLWRSRLKFEVLQEIINQKKPTATADATKPVKVDDPKTIVRKRYERLLKNVGEIESSEIAEMFINCFARLYDPHSDYFSADTYADFSIQIRLSLVGIGALLGTDEDQDCEVEELVPGGPADLGKQLQPKDKVIAVAQDGEDPVDITGGMKLRKIVNMIRGEKGTKVHLTVVPASDPTSRKEIVITRDTVNLDSARATAAVFDVPTGTGKATVPIGVITLPGFYGPENPTDKSAVASKDVAELIRRLQARHVEGIVLDLRNNGGGLLSEAINLTGLFIKGGPVVQVRNYDGNVATDSDPNPDQIYTGPLAVLVSRFSASASEIVAGALQNYGRAIIVGDSSTHGKGTVQSLEEMEPFDKGRIPGFAPGPLPLKSGATKITLQKFYLPNGSSTQRKGVVPDIILPSVDDYIPKVGESNLPHALAWDEIPPSKTFDGHALEANTLTPLRAASAERQKKLPEFSYLNETIDWFKQKEDEKAVSLNLVARQQEKADDAKHKKQMDAELKALEKSDSYTFNEILLAPPAPPRIKDKTTDDDDDPEAAADDDTGERYHKMDIPLREALRVVDDSTHLDPEPPLWQSAAPLAVEQAASTVPAAATP
jgi:carboxyl-terminal processing protease